MKRRDFLKNTAVASSVSLLPSSIWGIHQDKKLRTAHIGVGGMGAEDLKSVSSHKMVEVVALCDVDTKNLEAAKPYIQMPEVLQITVCSFQKWQMR